MLEEASGNFKERMLKGHTFKKLTNNLMKNLKVEKIEKKL